MRDILRSNKGRTKTQRDYGTDAGDYVPALERRAPRPIGSIVSTDGQRAHSKHAPRGWNSSALAVSQTAAVDFGALSAAHLVCVAKYPDTAAVHERCAVDFARQAAHDARKVAK